ncbi:MAG: hypothetical protein Q7J84_10565 [Sulfuricaulis sp.]|nr:hypothetical protein [Sulfuricaulis sp.]
MSPAQFQRFAEAYAPAVLAAVQELKPDLCGDTAEEYALAASMSMLDGIERAGVESISHYLLNSAGGAFRRTCEALGIPNTRRAMEQFLEATT